MMQNFETMAQELLDSGLFDARWYNDAFPDAAIAGLDPLTHFLKVGMRLHRDPGPRFSTRYYIENNPDVVTAGFHPLVHYIYFGRAEGRQAAPPGRAAGGLVADDNASNDEAVAIRNGTDAFGLRGLEPQAMRAVIVNARTLSHWRDAVAAITQLDIALDLFVLGPLSSFDCTLLPAVVSSITHVGMDDEAGNARGLVRLAASGALDSYVSVLWLSPVENEGMVQLVSHDRLTAKWQAFDDRPDWACAGDRTIMIDPANEVDAPLLRGVRTALERIGSRATMARTSIADGWAIWFKPFLLRGIGVGLHIAEMAADGSDGRVPGRIAVLALVALLGTEAGMDCSPIVLPPDRQTWPEREVKTVAFYLPQFHPIPENDRWWGKGFTEWSNVASARPLFDNHYQPRMPADLGYYDLRLEETQVAQADLANAFGIHGFCYYYYWFDGKKLLNHPIEQMHRSSKIDTGFCVCWANENWSRSWDGHDKQILMEQSYSLESNIALIRELILMMKDPRWIRHQGKPVLLVYRIAIIPNWIQTARIWREECRRAGLGEIHLCAVRFGLERLQGRPEDHGLDGYVLFPPHESARESLRDEVANLLPDFAGEIFDYNAVVDTDLKQHADAYSWPVHRGAMLAWDNSARRGNRATLFAGANPYIFRRWMKGIVEQEVRHNADGESLLFVNAWNEWAEGTYLEPDQRWGATYLSAYRSALAATGAWPLASAMHQDRQVKE